MYVCEWLFVPRCGPVMGLLTRPHCPHLHLITSEVCFYPKKAMDKSVVLFGKHVELWDITTIVHSEGAPSHTNKSLILLYVLWPEKMEDKCRSCTNDFLI